jgi:hypothetical protein
MAATFSRRVHFAAAPDRVAAVITSPAFLEARHRLQGAAAVRVEERHRDERRLVQVAAVEEYVHTLTGTDRSRTEPTTTTYEWDLAQRRCRWRYRGAHGERVRVGGELALTASADGCDLASRFEVAVDYPLIGRVIEKRVLDEIKGGLASFDRLVHEALAAPG